MLGYRCIGRLREPTRRLLHLSSSSGSSTVVKTPSILEFTSCSSYLKHVLRSCDALALDWGRVQSEIVDTLPAFEPDDDEIDESPMALIDDKESKEEMETMGKNNSARHRRYVRGRMRVKLFNVDFFVLDMCERMNELDAATSYLHFIRNNGRELNGEQREKLYRVAIKHAVTSKTMTVSQDMRKLILQELKNDNSDKELVNWSNKREVSSYLLRTGALVLVDDVEEANSRVEKLLKHDLGSFSSQLSAYILSLAASRALLDDRNETFWDILKTPMFHQFQSPLKRSGNQGFIEALESLFAFYVDHVIKLDEYEKRFNHFMEYMANTGLFFTHNMKDKLEQSLNDSSRTELKQWTVTETTVNEKGECEQSGHKLPLTVFSAERLRRLEEQVMKTLLTSQLHFRSNPKELEDFKSFLEEMGTFDVVIDGLNVGIMNNKPSGPFQSKKRVQEKFFEIQGQRLLATLELLHSKGLRRPLLIYRPYLLRLPNFKSIKRLCRYVLFNRHSDDDIFTLITTMRSGPRTFLLSNDQYRPYNIGLEDSELSLEFIQWQIGRQIRHEVDHRGAQLQFPPCFDVRACSVSKNEWLTPLEIDWSQVRDKHCLNLPQKWLWIRKRS